MYTLFYSHINGKRTKVIPIDFLLINLDEIALAIWSIDDGKKVGYGFGVCTHNFTPTEVYRLAGLLHYKFNLQCSVHTVNKTSKIIYIKAESIPLFRSIVAPHFVGCIKYKLRPGKQLVTFS